MEKLVKPKEKPKEEKKVEKKDEEAMFKTKTARNIHRIISVMRSKNVERNDLFTPGRMAYVIDLEDDTEGDIPTTLIRSKADVPTIDNTPTLTTNDIVINKLAQILSYLRQGNRHGKKGKKNKDGRGRPDDFNDLELVPQKNVQDDSIYGDIGDYVPSVSKLEANHSKSNKKKEPYFNKPAEDFSAKENAPQLPNVAAASAAGKSFCLLLVNISSIKYYFCCSYYRKTCCCFRCYTEKRRFIKQTCC